MEQERRRLLRHLLVGLQARGREVILPVGCSDYEDWLLDAINLDRLFKQDALGATVDLAQCTGGGPFSGDSEVSSPTRVALPSASELRAEARRGVPDDGLPQLIHISEEAALGLEEDHLRELAYVLFVDFSAGKPAPGVLADLRSGLEMNETRGSELEAVAAAAGGRAGGGRDPATLQWVVALLKAARPSAFRSFKSFVRWRDGASAVVWAVLAAAAGAGWRAGTPGSGFAGEATAHAALARLRGAMRRLDARHPDDFEDREYAAAAAGVEAAAEDVARRCAAGWALPWALRARLAELLLRGAFDALDGGGAPAPGAGALLEGLARGAWPALGVSPQEHLALYAWAHFRQYAATGAAAPLAAGRDVLLQMAPAPAPPPVPAAAGGAAEVPGDDAAGVLARLAAAATALLGDYRDAAPDPRCLRGLLALLQACESVRARDATFGRTLEACVASSVRAAFRRKQAALGTAVPPEEAVRALAVAAGEIMRSEAAEFSPLLLPHLPAARVLAAAELHAAFGAVMLPWLVAVTALSPPALEAVRACLALEDVLATEMRAGGGAAAPAAAPWGVAERLSPLLYAWAQGQIATLSEWVDRIVAAETWAPPAGGGGRAAPAPGAAARSAVDALRVATEAVEALFSMRVALPPGVVRCLVEGVDAALQRYCDRVAEGVAGAEAFVPPAPPLTRYKQDIAVAAEELELGAARGRLGAVRGRVEAALTTGWLPALGHSEAEGRLLAGRPAAAAARLNSLQHVADGLPALEALVRDKWGGGRPASAGDADNYDWAGGMFAGAAAAAAAAQAAVARYVALRLVCADLRRPLFEELYRFHAAAARLDPVLSAVDAALGEVCGALRAEALPPLVARAVCAALAAGLRHVLLDGGPSRLFTRADVDAVLEPDAGALRAMFLADGSGLPPAEVDAALAPVADVLAVMRLDTPLLVAALQRRGSGAAAPAAAALDPDALVKVLCHRADHAASKFLKSAYKVPKKLPAAIVYTNKAPSPSFVAFLGQASPRRRSRSPRRTPSPARKGPRAPPKS